MPSKPFTVAVALCTHNGARFVDEQVASILAQSTPPTELVLSDDASTDDTVARVERLVRDSRVTLTVLRNEVPLGFVKNFEQAVAAASSDLIFLSDQDDRWHPNRVERTVAEFAAHPRALAVHSDAALIDADGSPLGRTFFEAVEAGRSELDALRDGGAFGTLLRRNLVLGATLAFRRELLESALPFADGWVHDAWLAVVAAALNPGGVRVIDEPLIDYRQHGANLIGAAERSLWSKFARLREPRSPRNDRLLLAASSLVERLSILPVSPEVAASAEENLRHERFRSSLPVSRWKRVGPVLSEWRSGRYRWSPYGAAGVLADVLQGARR